MQFFTEEVTEELSVSEIEERIIRLNKDGLFTVYEPRNPYGKGTHRVEMSNIQCFIDESLRYGITYNLAVQNIWSAITDPEKLPMLMLNIPTDDRFPEANKLLLVRWNSSKDDWEDISPMIVAYEEYRRKDL